MFEKIWWKLKKKFFKNEVFCRRLKIGVEYEFSNNQQPFISEPHFINSPLIKTLPLTEGLYLPKASFQMKETGTNAWINLNNSNSNERIFNINVPQVPQFENFQNQNQSIEINCSPFQYWNVCQEALTRYCRWDLDNQEQLCKLNQMNMFSTIPEASEPLNDYIHMSTSDNLEVKSKMSKSDKNLELLKNFEYITETRTDETIGKDVIIYIWKHDGCNKEFTRTWNILDHARVHMGVKPFTCNFCFKGFTQKGNLKKHLKTHTLPNVENRKRYYCEACGSSYTERYNFKVIEFKWFFKWYNNILIFL